jgi:hypothetical protein
MESFDKSLLINTLPLLVGGDNVRLTDIVTLNLQETFGFF